MSDSDGVQCKEAKTSNPLHQIPDACFEGVCYGLNCEQGRILHATLNAAQKGAVNVGLSREGFLGQAPLQPHFSNTVSELFRNVMAHSAECYPATTLVAVGHTQQQA